MRLSTIQSIPSDLRHLLILTASVLCAVADLQAGSLADRLPQWDAGVRGGIPQVTTVRELQTADLASKPAEAIQAAIDAVQSPGAVKLPAGRFILDRSIRMRTGVVLRGSGQRATELVFAMGPQPVPEGVRPALGAVRFEGKRLPTEYSIQSGTEAGSQRLNVATTKAFEVGDLILVYSENDSELMYTDPRWDRDWAAQSIAQIVQVARIEGAALVIDTPLRLDLKPELQPRIQRIQPIEHAGLENIHLRRIDEQHDNIVGIEAALNCWVIDCETEMTGRGHIWINFSRFVTVAGNECHQAISYGGGGNGYGIVAGNIAVDNLIENNLLHAHRHALMAKRGSSGNVFAFNYSYDRRPAAPGRPLLCDVSLHGHYPYQNLFEGNVVEFVELADFWGPTGPYTTFFRNHVADRFEVNDHSHDTIVWANRLPATGIQTDGTSQRLIAEANLAHSAEGDQPQALTLPASLYRTEKPDFWGELSWPSIGPDVVPFEGARIPAEERSTK